MKSTKQLVLASNSPRRKQLMTDLGFDFTVEVRPTDEIFPADMPPADVPGYLASQKADQFLNDISGRVIVCADTVVICEGRILNKPADVREATEMLNFLSGKSHEVVTAVHILTESHRKTITDSATVVFRTLTAAEIDHYIQKCQPFDKAGAYGIQEWIGMVGIERIEGSFYTIMGLPVHLVYTELSNFL